MSRRHLQVVERDGHSKRHVVSADNYEELARKLAKKAGLSVTKPRLRADGGHTGGEE